MSVCESRGQVAGWWQLVRTELVSYTAGVTVFLPCSVGEEGQGR